MGLCNFALNPIYNKRMHNASIKVYKMKKYLNIMQIMQIRCIVIHGNTIPFPLPSGKAGGIVEEAEQKGGL